jgi:hypothetical protein
VLSSLLQEKQVGELLRSYAEVVIADEVTAALCRLGIWCMSGGVFCW